MSAIPTLIRGQLYPSQTAAARALNVAPSGINRAIEMGLTDTVGLCKMGLRKMGAPGKPCYLNGRRWPSRAEAARALGVTTSAVSQALRRPNRYVRPGGKGVLV